MAEQISKQLYRLTKYIPFPVLRRAKLAYRYHRFHAALEEGRAACLQVGGGYKNKILFVAGLPKSGTSWLETMLGAYPGYTIIPNPEITVFEFQHGGSEGLDLDQGYFDKISDTLALVKVHVHSSDSNLSLLRRLDIPYCVMYRDLRDAAVSYVHYVKRTHWHPAYPDYKSLSIREGLEHFGKTLLPVWRDWVAGWEQKRDPSRSVVLRYEDLLADPAGQFRRVVDLFDLPVADVETIIGQSAFDKLQTKGSFFRKGVSGDWLNSFDDDLSALYKEIIGEFLVTYGYEKSLDWPSR